MNVDISAHVQHRMRALGISSQMVSTALNAPDRVRRLPLSAQRSFFRAFDERTIRVLTTLDDCVIDVSWAARDKSAAGLAPRAAAILRSGDRP